MEVISAPYRLASSLSKNVWLDQLCAKEPAHGISELETTLEIIKRQLRLARLTLLDEVFTQDPG